MADHNAPCGCDESLRLREQVRLLQDKAKLDEMAQQGVAKQLDGLRRQVDYYRNKLETVKYERCPKCGNHMAVK
jgi:hypothetical protein